MLLSLVYPAMRCLLQAMARSGSGESERQVGEFVLRYQLKVLAGHAAAPIITDGSHNFSGTVTIKFATPGGQAHLVLMTHYFDPATCSNSYQYKFTQVMTITDTDTLFYTPCDVTITNSTPGMTGQVFGRNITTSNNFTINGKGIPVPGYGTAIGFDENILFYRGVRNPT